MKVIFTPHWAVVSPFPLRTNATDLSDDELLLLDAMFKFERISENQFCSDEYSDHMNRRYTHSYADDEYHQAFISLEQRGIASMERFEWILGDGADDFHNVWQ
jgi:hypothetical protein